MNQGGGKNFSAALVLFRFQRELERLIVSPEDRQRISALDGGAAPRGQEETLYQNQAGSARRLLERIVELDERLSRRMGGNDSFYAQKK